MRTFRRTTTREHFEIEKEWQKGYTFSTDDVSDILACEKNNDGSIGRMHLMSSLVELVLDKV